MTARLLLLYRLLVLLLTPLLLLLLGWRLLRGKEDPRRLGERLGWSRRQRPAGPLLWLHAASVGELVSLLPLLEQVLAEASPDLHVLLTTVTRTSGQLAVQRLPPRVIHQYVPLDHWLAFAVFRRHWRPDLGVLAEAELWPELIHAMPSPLLINARMSARSFQRHRRWPLLSRWLLPRFQACLAQSQQDAERFRSLGSPGVVVAGSTKLDGAPLRVNGAMLRRLQQVFAARPVLLLASSHGGEERLLLEAYPDLRQQLDGLALLLVPRHPQRAAEVVAQAGRAGLAAATWSQLAAQPPRPGLDVVVADMIGEMGTWITASRLVLMGGCLLAGGRCFGGHNPLEPLRLGRPVLCGPDMANFAELTRQLAQSGWLQQCSSTDQLWPSLASHPAWRGEPLRSPPGLEGPSRRIAGLILTQLNPELP